MTVESIFESLGQDVGGRSLYRSSVILPRNMREPIPWDTDVDAMLMSEGALPNTTALIDNSSEISQGLQALCSTHVGRSVRSSR